MKKSFLLFFVCSLLFSTVSAQDLYEAVEAKDHAKVESLLKSGAKVNKTNKKNQFPLWIALWNDDVEMVKLLIANGADVSLKNQQGYTAQDRARNAGQAKAEEVLKGSKN